jgi:hypothetical protein
MPNAMTHFPSFDPGLADFRNALRCVPSAVLQGVMALSVLCALAPGAINAMQLEQPATAANAPAVSPAAASALDVRKHCAGCGFVQSIRHVGAAGLLPAAYEFTVRMRDGSVRTSSDASEGRWRVGDRIILVGGPTAAAL